MAKRKTHDEFIKEIYELVGDEYTFLEPYENVIKKLLCRHNTCGFTWRVLPADFISSGSRCHLCASSKEEINISIFKK